MFNFGRNEVRNFLIASARYWLEEMHVDGLRVDAVASMLYLDYSRRDGEWVPNRHGGRENLEAIAFLQEMNTVVHRDIPGVLTVAEESTAWGGVSRPGRRRRPRVQRRSGTWAGCTTPSPYFSTEPVHRTWHHDLLTFGLIYAWSENFVLPLSHDEVVHLKGSLLGKMPGDHWQRFANLRALYAWMWSPPRQAAAVHGRRDGARSASGATTARSTGTCSPTRCTPGVRDLLRELNRVEADRPRCGRPTTRRRGSSWLDADDREASVYSFLRRGDGRGRWRWSPTSRRCRATATGSGLPQGGRWVDVLNTDDERWGGSGVAQPEVDGRRHAVAGPARLGGADAAAARGALARPGRRLIAGNLSRVSGRGSTRRRRPW